MIVPSFERPRTGHGLLVNATRRVAYAPVLPFVLAFVATAIVAAPVFAQGFKSDPVNEQLRGLRGVVRSSSRDPNRYAAEKERVLQYFREYYFPSMTLTTPEALGDVGKSRQDLFDSYIRPAEGNPIRADLTKLALEFATRVFRDSAYHPAVRYNAVLMLGMLDAQYALETGGQKRPPEPLPEATDLLTKIVTYAGKSQLVTPGILVAAIVGLERHARYGASLPAQMLADIQKSLLQIVNRQKLFGETTREVDQWIRRQAAGALVALPGPTGKQETATALVSLINDEEVLLDERTAAAAYLAQLPLDAAGVNVTVIARSLVDLARDVSEDEEDFAQEYEDMQLGTGPGRRRVRFGDEPEGYDRSRLLARLQDLTTALEAVAPVASDDKKAKVDNVLTTLQTVQSLAEDEETLDLELVQEIKRAANTIDDVASSWEPDPPAPAPENGESDAGSQ